MQHDIRRSLTAWTLLSVFVPMLLLSSLHVHADCSAEVAVCSECADHVTHHSHLSSGSSVLHDCVLCQFLTFTYLSAAVVAVLVFADKHRRPLLPVSVALRHTTLRHYAGRAPPRCSFA